MIDYANDIRIHLILSVITKIQSSKFKTEKEKQQFLYDLAMLNSLATKGYMVERTSIDESIYSTKRIACEFMAMNWPTRCRYDRGYSWRAHSSVLYIYAGGRQYSFHVDLPSTMTVAEAHYNEWDRLEGGWQLSDEEYREARTSYHSKHDSYVVVRSLDERKRAAMYLSVVNHYLQKRDIYERYHDQAYAKFWRELSLALTTRKRKNKCFVDRDFRACYWRYYTLIADYFTDEEKSVFKGCPVFDYLEIDEIRRKCASGIILLDSEVVKRKLLGIVEAMDSGTLTADKLYEITK